MVYKTLQGCVPVFPDFVFKKKRKIRKKKSSKITALSILGYRVHTLRSEVPGYQTCGCFGSTSTPLGT